MSKIKYSKPGKFFLGFLAILILISLLNLDYYNLIPYKSFTSSDFDIEVVESLVDYNHNGIDDYHDFLIGARKDANNHPKYDGRYFEGGYPPEHIGVCTDVIWRAFKEAGYSLREMVDEDIKRRGSVYATSVRDNNIDFRRVANLQVFFDEYAISLSTNVDEIEKWQAGDIVVFENHIGIISDKRNARGRAYVIHNGGQPIREEDYFKRNKPIAHYRFDASLVPQEILFAWK